MFLLASERGGQVLQVLCYPPSRKLGWNEQISTDVAWSTLSGRKIRFLIIVANIYHKIKIFSPQIQASIKMKNSIISWCQMPFLTSSLILIIFLGQVIVQVFFCILIWQSKWEVWFFFSSESLEILMTLFVPYLISQTWLCSSLKAGTI